MTTPTVSAELPEALRLAELLEKTGAQGSLRDEAAAELRRQHAENEALRASLAKANTQAEHFEREWYLRGDELEALHAQVEALSAAQAGLAAMRAGGEPVGYYYKFRNAFGCEVWSTNVPRNGQSVLEVQPLYAHPRPAAPLEDGFTLVAVKGLDDLMYWLDRCESKGHLENCSDLIEPWENFEYRAIAAQQGDINA